MSQENVEIVRRLFEAFNRLHEGADVASHVAAHFDPDCEYQPVEETGTIRGHDALTRWHERWFEAWDETMDEIDDVIEAGEMVVTAVRVHGRGRQSGMEISQRLFHVFEVRDDKILRVREYLDRHQALEAAGLPE
jgi:ketosteroid isomerase-like protein